MNKLTRYQILILSSGIILVSLAYLQQYCNNWFGMTEKTQLWINTSFLNFGYSLIASVVVIFFYNRVQEKSREEELIKRRKIALSLLRQPVYRLFDALIAMYRATAINYNKPSNIPIRDFFDEDYFANAIHLDFGKPLHQFSSLVQFTWFETFAERIVRLTEAIDIVIKKYSDYLDPDMVDQMERINNLFFTVWAKGLPTSFKNYEYLTMLKKNPTYYPGRMDGVIPESFQEFVCDFILIVENYNSCVDSDKKIKFDPNKNSVDLGSALLDTEQLEIQEKSIRESLIIRGKINKG